MSYTFSAQVTLGDFIEWLEGKPRDETLSPGLCSPHSYRGFYEDLAFETCESATMGEMLEMAKGCLGKSFYGYKGGEYTMDEDTVCWVAEYGCSGYPLMATPAFSLVPYATAGGR